MLWAVLTKRVLAEDVGSCVNCRRRMELRAVVIRPAAAVKVLDGLEKDLGEIRLSLSEPRS